MMKAFTFLCLTAVCLMKTKGMTTLTVRKYDNLRHRMVNNTVQKILRTRSLSDCVHMCVERLGNECQSVAYDESNTVTCMISSEFLVTDTDLIEILQTLLSSYALFSANPCVDGYKYNPHSRTCVGLYSMGLTWQQAKDHCEGIGEHYLTLVTLKDAEWLHNHRQTDPAFAANAFIGGWREAGVWYWRGKVTDAISYEFWGGTDPNDNTDCMIVFSWTDGLFADSTCTGLRSHFCETDHL